MSTATDGTKRKGWAPAKAEWLPAHRRVDVVPPNPTRTGNDVLPMDLMNLQAAIARAGLPIGQAAQYVYLLWKCGPRDGVEMTFRPRLGEMAEAWGVSRSTLGEKLDAWEARGLIIRKRTKFGGQYQFYFPVFSDLIAQVRATSKDRRKSNRVSSRAPGKTVRPCARKNRAPVRPEKPCAVKEERKGDSKRKTTPARRNNNGGVFDSVSSTGANLAEARRVLRKTHDNAIAKHPEITRIQDIDRRWLDPELRTAPEDPLTWARRFTVQDVVNGWAAWNGRSPKKQALRWGGRWISNELKARLQRAKAERCRTQEREADQARDDERRTVANAPADFRGLRERVGNETDEQARARAWKALPEAERNAKRQAVIDATGAKWETAEFTAMSHHWNALQGTLAAQAVA